MILPVIIGVVAVVAISSKKKKNNESANNNIPVDVVNTPSQPAGTNVNTQNQQQNSKPKPKPNTGIPTPVRNAIVSSAISAAAGALRGVDEYEYTGFYADKLL